MYCNVTTVFTLVTRPHSQQLAAVHCRTKTENRSRSHRAVFQRQPSFLCLQSVADLVYIDKGVVSFSIVFVYPIKVASETN